MKLEKNMTICSRGMDVMGNKTINKVMDLIKS